MPQPYNFAAKSKNGSRIKCGYQLNARDTYDYLKFCFLDLWIKFGKIISKVWFCVLARAKSNDTNSLINFLIKTDLAGNIKYSLIYVSVATDFYFCNFLLLAWQSLPT